MKPINIVDFNDGELSLFSKFLQWMSGQHNFPLLLEQKNKFSTDDLKDAQGAVLNLKASAELVPNIRFCPTQVREFGVFDFMFFEDHQWYPRLIFYEALRQVLVKEARELDIRAPAFVVGNGPEVRIISAVLSELGVKEIYFVGAKKSLELEKLAVLKTRIGLKVDIVGSEFLTNQSLNGGLIINSLDLRSHPAELVDLSYFNFIKEGGYVMDLNLYPIPNPYLEEAERAELRVVKPIQFWTAKTRLWCSKIMPEFDTGNVDFDKCWQDFLSQNS